MAAVADVTFMNLNVSMQGISRATVSLHVYIKRQTERSEVANQTGLAELRLLLETD